MSASTHYELLELPREADQDTVRRAYLAQVSQCHPDKLEPGTEAWVAANDRLKDLNAAYATLKDAKRRAIYDRDVIGQSRAVVQEAPKHAPTEAELEAKVLNNRERYRAALNSEEVKAFCGAIGMENTRMSALGALDRFEAAAARNILQRYLAHSS